tara:strand:- start:6529 stop:7476 length:948 start_codon:yes stop_codon:yes gene_type:complete
MRSLLTILSASLVVFGVVGATGQALADYPEKPVRLVIPYPPGGGASLHAGVIATVAEPYLGQPLIMTIRTGGGGIKAAEWVTQQPADGYTVLMGDITINSLRPLVEEVPFKSSDFTPIGRITLDPLVFVAAKEAPFSNIKEMVAYAKKNPGDLVYSSDNVNGWTYVAFKALKKATGTEMRGIDFGGGGPAVANVLGGHTMAYAGAPAVVGPHIASGALKALCTGSTKRASTLPDVPTCEEEGFPVQWEVWLGLFVHKDTPAPVVEHLRKAFTGTLNDKGMARLIAKINSEINHIEGGEWVKVLAEEQERLKKIYE